MALVLVQTVLLTVLTVLVAGLLRAHGTVLPGCTSSTVARRSMRVRPHSRSDRRPGPIRGQRPTSPPTT